MQDDHRQRHHRLRSGYCCRFYRLRGKIHSEKDWHADSYQKHKEERDCCRHIAFEYPYLNGIMRIVKEENPVIVSQKFEMDCEMTLRIRKGEAERLKARLLKVESVYIPRTEF